MVMIIPYIHLTSA